MLFAAIENEDKLIVVDRLATVPSAQGYRSSPQCTVVFPDTIGARCVILDREQRIREREGQVRVTARCYIARCRKVRDVG